MFFSFPRVSMHAVTTSQPANCRNPILLATSLPLRLIPSSSLQHLNLRLLDSHFFLAVILLVFLHSISDPSVSTLCLRWAVSTSLAASSSRFPVVVLAISCSPFADLVTRIPICSHSSHPHSQPSLLDLPPIAAMRRTH